MWSEMVQHFLKIQSTAATASSPINRMDPSSPLSLTFSSMFLSSYASTEWTVGSVLLDTQASVSVLVNQMLSKDHDTGTNIAILASKVESDYEYILCQNPSSMIYIFLVHQWFMDTATPSYRRRSKVGVYFTASPLMSTKDYAHHLFTRFRARSTSIQALLVSEYAAFCLKLERFCICQYFYGPWYICGFLAVGCRDCAVVLDQWIVTGRKFRFPRRKYCCCICGQIFCGQCTRQIRHVPVPFHHFEASKMRCCRGCYDCATARLHL